MKAILSYFLTVSLITCTLSGCSYTRQYALRNERNDLCKESSIKIIKTVEKTKAFSVTSKYDKWVVSQNFNSTIMLLPVVMGYTLTFICDLLTIPFKQIPKRSNYSINVSIPVMIMDQNGKPLSNTLINVDGQDLKTDGSGCLQAFFYEWNSERFPSNIERKMQFFFFGNSDALLDSQGEAYFAEPGQIDCTLTRQGKSFMISGLPEKVVVKHVIDEKRKKQIRQEQKRIEAEEIKRDKEREREERKYEEQQKTARKRWSGREKQAIKLLKEIIDLEIIWQYARIPPESHIVYHIDFASEQSGETFNEYIVQVLLRPYSDWKKRLSIYMGTPMRYITAIYNPTSYCSFTVDMEKESVRGQDDIAKQLIQTQNLLEKRQKEFEEDLKGR